MTTVKEFGDLGVVFVDYDQIKGTGTSQDSFNLSAVLFGDGINHSGENCLTTVILGKRACNGWIVTSFAWRPLNTLPDNPKFKFEAGLMIDNEWTVWRPLLDQSATETLEEAKVFNKMKPYDFDAHVSVAKLVFTQAMADRGEFPPVGSECQAYCTDTSGSWLWAKAEILKNNLGTECAVYCIDLGILRWSDQFKPIDTRTPKQKAVDNVMTAICFDRRSAHTEVVQDILGDAYELGLIKC